MRSNICHNAKQRQKDAATVVYSVTPAALRTFTQRKETMRTKVPGEQKLAVKARPEKRKAIIIIHNQGAPPNMMKIGLNQKNFT